MKRLLTRDELAGSATYFHVIDGKVGIENLQDITDVIEGNKRAQNAGNNGWTPSRDMKHVATIPNIVLMQWANEAGVKFNDSKAMQEIIKKKMNDPDFRLFRTGLGKV
jgi:hypothetical protein